ncbi:leucyl/phenylalanyl-tRNA--protein transferase [Altererythrobacter sp. GH1-8]|uniref:leucyl/phenylalanyl-tRNA--protein transferase n=1 Tax=Altererythrobacter sp. GH1-8 TaxID=3349333 RepID=UPI00374C8E65
MHAPMPEPIPVEMLLLAYRSGIFPMADRRDDPELFWVEPRERAIIPLDGLRVSKSLRKTLRQDRFSVKINRAFDDVIASCAAPRPGHPESWISMRIQASYRQLHDAGHAHSIECWDRGRLVGGLYGVSFDRVFCGESMFSLETDASKVALCWLVAMMRRAGFALLDCQFMTDHLGRLGARELPQADYLRKLEAARGAAAMPLPVAHEELLLDAQAAHSSPGKFIAQSFTQTS